ncbi:MAG: hypothetical protein ABSG98_06525 [Anaerolineales bacterium]
MERRYSALRTIGSIYKFLGGVVLAITILIVIGFCFTSVFGGTALGNTARQLGAGPGAGGVFTLAGVILSIVAVLIGGGISLGLFARGEQIYLFIALEENTRANALALQALVPGRAEAKR